MSCGAVCVARCSSMLKQAGLGWLGDKTWLSRVNDMRVLLALYVALEQECLGLVMHVINAKWEPERKWTHSAPAEMEDVIADLNELAVGAFDSKRCELGKQRLIPWIVYPEEVQLHAARLLDEQKLPYFLRNNYAENLIKSGRGDLVPAQQELHLRCLDLYSALEVADLTRIKSVSEPLIFPGSRLHEYWSVNASRLPKCLLIKT